MMMSKGNVLLIDDDEDVLIAYKDLLELEGYSPIISSNPVQAINLIDENWNGIIVSDIYMPELSGWDLLTEIQKKDCHLPVIFITGHGDVPMAIKAMQKGAFYFIEKPIYPEDLLKQIELALEIRENHLSRKLNKKEKLESAFIGKSQWIKQLRDRLYKLSETDLSIFIFGEDGTGRTLSANYLYDLCKDKFPNKKFIELFSEFDIDDFDNILDGDFNNENSFVIIKNIEFLTIKSQKKLANTIKNKSGAMRLVGISQYSPQELLQKFGLLPELFYIFSLTQVECVPLSYRGNDIELLFRHFVSITCDNLNKKKPNISDNYVKGLLSRQWQGNINQLINMAELYAVGVVISNDNLYYQAEDGNELSLDDLVEEYEKNIIINVLDRFQGKINDAATYLQIPRKKLYLRMNKYNLNKEDYKE
ncbi:sigma-54-dependent transcriptional regulator [Ursidibacter sp. B-7004-1]